MPNDNARFNFRFNFKQQYRFLLVFSFALLGTSWLVVSRAAERAFTPATIATVAGGGFGSSVPVRQAPMDLPTAVVLDPQGRGFFVVDEIDGASLLRFVNTSTNPVTLAGAVTRAGEINLLAGSGVRPEDGVPARDADLAKVTGLAIDPTATLAFLAVPAFNAIRAVNLGATEQTVFGRTLAPGTITTLVSLSFADVRAVTMQRVTRELFFIAGNQVYRIEANGTVAPFAGGGVPPTGNGDGAQARQAKLVNPRALAFDTNNNLLIAEGGDARSEFGDGAVRRVAADGTISSLANRLGFPIGVAVAPNGNIYVALGNQQQLAIVAANGNVTTVAGNSSGVSCNQLLVPNCGDNAAALAANLNMPDSSTQETLTLAADNRGIYLPDYRFRRIRFVNLSNAPVTISGTNINSLQLNTIVGSGDVTPYDLVAATSSELKQPTGIALDPRGNLFIADTLGNRLRFVNTTAQPVTLFVTTPQAVTVQPGQIITLNRNAGETLDGDAITTALFSAPQGLLATANGVFVVDSQAGALVKPPNTVSGRRSGVVSFLNTSSADVVFYAGNAAARIVVPPGQIKDIAGVRPPSNPQGLGDGSAARQVAFFPTDIALDAQGNLYIADQGNNRIRRVAATNGVVSTVYGDGTTAILNRPTGLTLDSTGRVLIADTRNNRILRQNAAGGNDFSVIADSTKGVNQPRDLAIDRNGRIFITNSGSNQVLDLETPANQSSITSVVAGTGVAGFSGDGGAANQARLNFPTVGLNINDVQLTANVLVQENGDILFADTANNRIRQLRRTALPNVVTVSAASFGGNGEIAPNQIVAAFGSDLAPRVESSTATPLPTQLAGTSVRIIDASGREHNAGLFFVAPSQINYWIPAEVGLGNATVTVLRDGIAVASGAVLVNGVAPGLFSSNANGRGVAAATALRIRADNSQVYEPIAQFDSAQNAFVPIPIDLGPATDRVVIVLFGTGIRGRRALSSVTARIGNADAQVLYAGQQGSLVGLDQVNALIPRSLIGRGVVELALTVDGKAANPVTIQIR